MTAVVALTMAAVLFLSTVSHAVCILTKYDTCDQALHSLEPRVSVCHIALEKSGNGSLGSRLNTSLPCVGM